MAVDSYWILELPAEKGWEVKEHEFTQETRAYCFLKAITGYFANELLMFAGVTEEARELLEGYNLEPDDELTVINIPLFRSFLNTVREQGATDDEQLAEIIAQYNDPEHACCFEITHEVIERWAEYENGRVVLFCGY